MTVLQPGERVSEGGEVREDKKLEHTATHPGLQVAEHLWIRANK
jgi:hypothetical protein